MKILFICKHNRFRSKVAETIFNKLNKNIVAESAGTVMDEERPYIAPSVVEIMKEKGYSIKGKPKRIDKNKINNYDLLVIIAEDIDKEFFNEFKGKIIKWKISDTSESDLNGIRKRIDEIEKKVKRLTNGLS